MCGIAGIFQFDGEAGTAEIEAVRRMTNSLRHRGPDAWGISRQGRAVLGHRRLSIIDPSPAGNQPMADVSGEIWITYNGEIYNSPDLRGELIDKGCIFRSSSDTEVLIQGYREWGLEKLLERLRGMFAFALLDQSQPESQLILVRDRIGIKPLYFFPARSCLLFASEVRGLTASGLVPKVPDRSAFLEFLSWGSIPEPRTAIEGVFSLLPGHYLRIRGPSWEPTSYWDISDYLESSEDPARPDSEVVAELGSTLRETVQLHLLSDVPVGVFLSGGTDSSSLTLLAASGRADPLRTISVNFDEAEFNEGRLARMVADRVASRHTDVRVSGHDFMTQMAEVLRTFDQPSIDGVNTYFVSWAARRSGLKVVLSGLGGDEIFMGYTHFHNSGRGERACRLLASIPAPLRRAGLEVLVRAAGLRGRTGQDRLRYLNEPVMESYYRLYRGLFFIDDVQRLAEATREEIRGLDSQHQTDGRSFLKSLVAREFRGYLRNQLLRDTDVMSMHHSVEVRVPLLDHRLVEQVVALSDERHFRRGVNKPLLVDAMGELLPREVWDRPKQGFVFPIGRWLRQHFDQLRDEAKAGDWVDAGAVEDVWGRFKRAQIHWTRPWATLVWSHWQNSLG